MQRDIDAHLGDINPNLGQAALDGNLREEVENLGTEMMFKTRGNLRLARR